MSRRFTDIFLFFFYFCMTISTKHEAKISVHHNHFSGFNSIVSVPEQTKKHSPGIPDSAICGTDYGGTA